MELQVGVRVVLSDAARANGLDGRHPDRVGTIVGLTRSPKLRAVRWDGQKAASNYHINFLRVVRSGRVSRDGGGG